MLIYVRISEDLKGKVDALVSRGQYSDFSAAVSVALENLLLAEEEHATENSKRQLPVESSQSIEVPTPVHQPLQSNLASQIAFAPRRFDPNRRVNQNHSPALRLTLQLFDFVVGGGIIETAFPQQFAEFPGLFPLDVFTDRQGDCRTLFGLARNLAQIVEHRLIYVHGNSHLMKFASFIVYYNIFCRFSPEKPQHVAPL
jgi:Arc/MetJ-type ribon-helix-helix transcriptional regulator